MIPTDKRQPLNIEPGKDYIFLLDDMELTTTKEQLKIIIQSWNGGESIKSIAKKERRDPIEVLIALIHHAKRGGAVRPLGITL